MMKKTTIFDYQAQVGLTKHLGGLKSTQALFEGCKIKGGERVLEVGCGVGASSVYLASNFGCRVTGIDISERMIQRARERAQAKKVEHLTNFRPSGMDQLPFPANTFDVVFCESVLAFSQDKPKALSEMARVTQPGGFIGINETVWLQQPDAAWTAWFAQDMAANASTFEMEAWIHLLEQAGLELVSSHVQGIEIKDEARGLLQRYGWLDFLRTIGRSIAMYLQRNDYRQFVAETNKRGVTPGNPQEHLGYGLMIARKV
ncbi:MAG: class I SAM-dependent methyltransferase [Anaerolineales bacterium]|nr:MAG: class I SAM-dependent methyltransferase [Anaerolineales bacterium]